MNNDLPKNSTPLEIALAQLAADRLDIDVSEIKITLFAATPSSPAFGKTSSPAFGKTRTVSGSAASNHYAATPHPVSGSAASTEELKTEKLEKVLPFIAWQEHVDVWKEEYTIEQKRDIVATARQVHAQKGTIGALKLALKNLGLNSTIREWWQYEAEVEGAQRLTDAGVAQKKLRPHYFKIDINVSQTGLDETTHHKLNLVIEETKNLRSILDVIQIWLSSQAVYFAGAGVHMGENISILPFIQTNIEQASPTPFAAVISYELENLTIYPKPTA